MPAKTVKTAKRWAFVTFDSFGNGPEDKTGGYPGRTSGKLRDGRSVAAALDDASSLPSGDTAGNQSGALVSRTAFEERAALVEYGAGVPREWAEGFAQLDLATPPMGFDQRRWRTLINDGGKFLDHWGAEAARLGWSALDVFGVHPIAPAARFDAAGLVLLISSGEVLAINHMSATIKSRSSNSTLTYLRTPREGAVALWALQTAGVE